MNKKLISALIKRKQSIIGFFIGALSTLLIIALLTMLVEPPLFATGLLGGENDVIIINSDIIMYRMFPPSYFFSTVSIDYDDSYPYVGEFKILPNPPDELSVHEAFVPCNGKSVPKSKYQILNSVVSTFYGCDDETFNVPELNILGLSNYTTYLSNTGLYPVCKYREIESNIKTDKIIYIPSDGSFLAGSLYECKLQIGEILLVKAKDFSKLKNLVIPCDGQTLSSSEYPEYANAIVPGSSTFTVPNLKGKSPIEGAQYCVAINGEYPFHEYLPAGTMRCKSCHLVVPSGKYCNQCGAKNN